MNVYQFEAIGDVSVDAFGNYSVDKGMIFITNHDYKSGDIVRGEFMLAWIDGTNVIEGKPEIKFVYLLEEQDVILNEACRMFRDRDFNEHEERGGNDGWLDLYGWRKDDRHNKDCYIRIL